MTKGTASRGKHSKTTVHIRCRRCGSRSYHIRHNACSSCGFGDNPKMRSYNWMKK